MVLDASLLNTQHYKVRIKSNQEHLIKWSNPEKGVASSPIVVAIEKGDLGSPLTKVGRLKKLYSAEICQTEILPQTPLPLLKK